MHLDIGVVRRDHDEFAYFLNGEWLEPSIVADSLRTGEYQAWDVFGHRLEIAVVDEVIALRRTSDIDEEFRKMMSPMVGRSVEDPPTFAEIAATFDDLSLPDGTLLALWSDRASSMDWHRPWEPTRCWHPGKGLKKVSIWRRW